MTAVDDVKSRLDILEVVSHHVTLSRSGRNYKANCPFHQERTPSFYVFPDRQSWRCFGACATGGDVFSFVMRAENVDFGEALQRLARQTGVALPSRQQQAGEQAALSLNDATLRFFRRLLSSDQGAGTRAYLQGRGVSQESINRFELGLSPANGSGLKEYLATQGFTPEQGVEAGVLRDNDRGWSGDLFRGRLMIPIRDASGRLVGFGGRSLDDSQPKYLNSPRTPLFDKSRLLYGMHLAKDSARERGLVIVEGYLDALMAHQYGFSNVVASMGTALTREQVDQVVRLTKRVVMALDPDAAGQQATLRSLESSWMVFQTPGAVRARATTLFQKTELPEIRIATLPPGEDPDALIRRSPDEWTKLTETGQPLLEYLVDALATQVDASTPEGKSRLVELVFPLVAAVTDPLLQDRYFQSLAQRLGVSQETLRASVVRPVVVRAGARGSRTSQEPSVTASAFAKADRDPIEEYCLALLLQHPGLLEDDDNDGSLVQDHFRRHENREIFIKLARLLSGDGPGGPEQIALDPDSEALDKMRWDLDEELSQHLEALIEKPMPPLDIVRRKAAFKEAAARLEERRLKELKSEEELRFSDSEAVIDEDHQDVLEVNRKIKENQSARHALRR